MAKLKTVYDPSLTDIINQTQFAAPAQQALPMPDPAALQKLQDTADSWGVTRDVKIGGYQAQSSLYNAAAAALDAVGLQRFSDSLKSSADRKAQEGQYLSNFMPAQSLADAQGFGGTLGYLGHRAVQQIPQLALTIGAAAGARKLGLSPAAATAAGAIPTSVLSTGDIYQETRDAGNPSPWSSLLGGVVSGAMDAYVPASAVNRVLGGTVKKVALPQMAKNVGMGVAKGMFKEAGTEMGQELVQMGVGAAAGKHYTGDEVFNRLLESGVLGAAMGGPIEGASHLGADIRSNWLANAEAGRRAQAFNAPQQGQSLDLFGGPPSQGALWTPPVDAPPAPASLATAPAFDPRQGAFPFMDASGDLFDGSSLPDQRPTTPEEAEPAPTYNPQNGDLFGSAYEFDGLQQGQNLDLFGGPPRQGALWAPPADTPEDVPAAKDRRTLALPLEKRTPDVIPMGYEPFATSQAAFLQTPQGQTVDMFPDETQGPAPETSPREQMFLDAIQMFSEAKANGYQGDINTFFNEMQTAQGVPEDERINANTVELFAPYQMTQGHNDLVNKFVAGKDIVLRKSLPDFINNPDVKLAPVEGEVNAMRVVDVRLPDGQWWSERTPARTPEARAYRRNVAEAERQDSRNRQQRNAAVAQARQDRFNALAPGQMPNLWQNFGEPPSPVPSEAIPVSEAGDAAPIFNPQQTVFPLMADDIGAILPTNMVANLQQQTDSQQAATQQAAVPSNEPALANVDKAGSNVVTRLQEKATAEAQAQQQQDAAVQQQQAEVQQQQAEQAQAEQQKAVEQQRADELHALKVEQEKAKVEAAQAQAEQQKANAEKVKTIARGETAPAETAPASTEPTPKAYTPSTGFAETIKARRVQPNARRVDVAGEGTNLSDYTVTDPKLGAVSLQDMVDVRQAEIAGGTAAAAATNSEVYKLVQRLEHNRNSPKTNKAMLAMWDEANRIAEGSTQTEQATAPAEQPTAAPAQASPRAGTIPYDGAYRINDLITQEKARILSGEAPTTLSAEEFGKYTEDPNFSAKQDRIDYTTNPDGSVTINDVAAPTKDGVVFIRGTQSSEAQRIVAAPESTANASNTPVEEQTSATPPSPLGREETSFDRDPDLFDRLASGLDIPTPDGLESRGQGQRAPRTQDIRSEIKGAGIDISKAEAAGTVVIHDSLDTAPDHVRQMASEDTQALYDGKTVHIFASAIPDGHAKGVLVHDIGVHVGMSNLLGAEGTARLYSALRVAEVAGDANTRAAIADAKAAVENAGVTPDQAHYQEEVAAYLAEQYENAPRSFPQRLVKWVKDLVAGVRAGLFRMGVNVDLTSADVAAMARTSMARELANPVMRSASAPIKALESVRTADWQDKAPQAASKAAEAMTSAWDKIRHYVSKATDIPMYQMQMDDVIAQWNHLFRPREGDKDMLKAFKNMGIDPKENGGKSRLEVFKELMGVKARFEAEHRNKGLSSLHAWDTLSTPEFTTAKGEVLKGRELLSYVAHLATVNELQMGQAINAQWWANKNLPTDEYQAKVDAFNEANKAWDALGEKGQKVYHQVRNALYTSRMDMVNEFNGMIDRTVADKKEAADIKSTMAKSLGYQRGDYFPTTRVGEFFAEVRDKATGKVVHWEGFNTAAEARRALDNMDIAPEHAGYVNIKRSFVEQMSGEGAGNMLRLLTSSIDEAITDPVARESMMELAQTAFLNALPSTSALKRYAQRQNIAGSRADQLHQSTANAFISTSRLTAHYRYGDGLSARMNDLTQLQKDLPRFMPRSYDAVRATKVVDALVQNYYDDLRRTQTWVDRVATVATKTGMAWYLSNSAYFVNNLMQTPQMAVPYAMAKYGRSAMGKFFPAYGAAVRLFSASAAAAGNINALSNPLESLFPSTGSVVADINNVTDKEKAYLQGLLGDNAVAQYQALRRLYDENKLDVTLVHDMIAYAKGENQSGAANTLMRWGAMPGHLSEVANRVVTAIAVFNHMYTGDVNGKVDAASFEKAYAAVDDVVRNTHIDFSSTNRSRAGHNAVYRMVAQFQTFSVHLTALLVRNAMVGFSRSPNISAAEKATARKVVFNTMASYALFSGVRGMPFVMPAMALMSTAINAGRGKDEEPVDLLQMMNNNLPSFITHGVFSAMTQTDFSARLGSPLPFYRDQIGVANDNGKAMDQFILNHLGPVPSIARNVAMMTDSLSKGDLVGALAKGPGFLNMSNVVRAGVQLAHGGTPDSHGIITEHTGGWDAFVKALGYTSLGESKGKEQDARVKAEVRQMSATRSALLLRFAMAQHAGAEAEISSTREQIAQYNAGIGSRFPRASIRGDDLSRAVKGLRRQQAEADRYGVVIPKSYLGIVDAPVGN